MRLQEHAHRILQAVCLPPGFIVAIDAHTDNVVVHNSEYGFAITHCCLDDWPESQVFDDVRLAIDAIMDGHDTQVARIQPVSSLLEIVDLPASALLGGK